MSLQITSRPDLSGCAALRSEGVLVGEKLILQWGLYMQPFCELETVLKQKKSILLNIMGLQLLFLKHV